MRHGILLVTVGIALVIHALFGWPFSIIGAIIAGAWYTERPVLGGMVTLMVSWGSMMAYTTIIAPTETKAMNDVMGAFLGDIPGFAVYFVVFTIAAVLGGLGGWIGKSTISKKESN